MILILECIIGCIVFGTFIVLSVLKNKDMWIQEYPESVQRRYIELHPDIKIKEPEGVTPRVICMKLGACIVFLMLLIGSLLDLIVVAPCLFMLHKKKFTWKMAIALIAAGCIVARFLIPAEFLQPFQT